MKHTTLIHLGRIRVYVWTTCAHQQMTGLWMLYTRSTFHSSWSHGGSWQQERWTNFHCKLKQQAALNSRENYTLIKVEKTDPQLCNQHSLSWKKPTQNFVISTPHISPYCLHSTLPKICLFIPTRSGNTFQPDLSTDSPKWVSALKSCDTTY